MYTHFPRMIDTFTFARNLSQVTMRVHCTAADKFEHAKCLTGKTRIGELTKG